MTTEPPKVPNAPKVEVPIFPSCSSQVRLTEEFETGQGISRKGFYFLVILGSR